MLSPAAQAAARQVAENLDTTWRSRQASADVASLSYRPEMATWPTLHLDDVSAIPFLEGVVGVEFYQLRARLRASDGDVFVSTCPEIEDYERYNQRGLGLGKPRHIHTPAITSPGALSDACMHEESLARLCAFGRESGRLLVHPYMGSEKVWQLARLLEGESGIPVGVLAPPPPVNWIANDKARLTELVNTVLHETLNTQGTPETHCHRDAASLAMSLRAIGRTHDRVALKTPRCASAMGNQVYRSEGLLGRTDEELITLVQSFLTSKHAQPSEDVLATAWLAAESSPSTQLWIPKMGPPVVDGVYEQLLEGEAQVFLGSVPSGLEPAVNAYLREASLLVGTALQHLGYVGRCSFDFIVSDGTPYFVECNGRWGGTSTPMSLMDRLFPEGRPSYRATDFVVPHLVGKPFATLQQLIGDELYDARTGSGNFVLYNVGCLDAYGKFDVIAISDDAAGAQALVETRLPGLLGL